MSQAARISSGRDPFRSMRYRLLTTVYFTFAQFTIRTLPFFR